MGLLIAAIFFGAAILGGWPWSMLVFASIYLGQQELKYLFGAIGTKPSQTIVYSAAVLMVLMATIDKPQFLSPILTLTLIASFFRLLFRHPRATIGDIGGTLIAVFYMVFMPVHFILLRHLNYQPSLSAWQQPGLQYVIMTMAIISASDVAAYYVGKKMGRHLLYPEISPKKTREGAIGGMIGGVAFGVILALIGKFPLEHAVILSVLLVVVGQLGDLTESLMKRDVGIKDSGALLASHGGFLDRADSYIFSGAVCYYYIHWIVLQQGLAQDVIKTFRQFSQFQFGH
ncbi:MAG TPA: phosphatidate cytidylyltransferase [Coleofasciculaceae cyanobacterium]|jgi:phosphatidate cytidylyltransferase